MKKFVSLISKIRQLINRINSSHSRVDELKNRQRHNGLEERVFHVDMDVRWNSTFLMLNHVLTPQYKEIFVAYVRQFRGVDALTDEDVEVVKFFSSFLNIFYAHACQLSVVYSPTTYIALHSILQIALHFQQHLSSEVLK